MTLFCCSTLAVVVRLISKNTHSTSRTIAIATTDLRLKVKFVDLLGNFEHFETYKRRYRTA
jgi:hypothetical protein